MRCEVCQTIEKLNLDDSDAAHELFVCTCRCKLLQFAPRRRPLTLLSPYFDWMHKAA